MQTIDVTFRLVGPMHREKDSFKEAQALFLKYGPVTHAGTHHENGLVCLLKVPENKLKALRTFVRANNWKLCLDSGMLARDFTLPYTDDEQVALENLVEDLGAVTDLEWSLEWAGDGSTCILRNSDSYETWSDPSTIETIVRLLLAE